MEDQVIVDQIDKLMTEEHRLESTHTGEGLSGGDQERLAALEVQLDQCWDLLRQRRARRRAGLDPDEARARGGDTVEGYLQ